MRFVFVWVLSLFMLHTIAQEKPENILHAVGGRIQVSLLQYNGTELLSSELLAPHNALTTTGARWLLKMNADRVPGEPDAIDIKAGIKLQEGNASATAINLEFDFSSWSTQNYVLVPAIVYNGNRYDVLGHGYNPAYTREMYYNPKLPLPISSSLLIGSRLRGLLLPLNFFLTSMNFLSNEGISAASNTYTLHDIDTESPCFQSGALSPLG